MIRVKRGQKENLPTGYPGEPLMCLDTGEFYVGGNHGNVLINGPWVTPEAYGARGDGVHDDTAAVQAAIDAAWANQIPVVFSNKKYLAGNLTLRSDKHGTISLIGVSPSSLYGMPSAPQLCFTKTDLSDFITLTDPTIVGGWKQVFIRVENMNFVGADTNTPSTNTVGNGLFLYAEYITATCYFRNVSITGFRGTDKGGLVVYDGEYSHFDNVDISVCYWGAKLYNATNAASFTNFRAQWNVNGIYITGCTGQTWVAPTIQGNKNDGLYINGLDSSVFLSPHFEANNPAGTAGYYGLKIKASAGCANQNLSFVNSYHAITNDRVYLEGTAGWVNYAIKFDGLISFGANPKVIINDVYSGYLYFFGTASDAAMISNVPGVPIFIQPMDNTLALQDMITVGTTPNSMTFGGYGETPDAHFITSEKDYIGFLASGLGPQIIKSGGLVLTNDYTDGAGTSATNTLVIKSGTAPGSSPVDIVQLYSKPIFAGNAVPHFRTENGTIIKLDQAIDTTATPSFAAVKVGANQVVGAQALTQAALKADYTTGDLDTEAEIIAAINATNAGFNTLLAKLKTHGLLASA